MHQQSHINNSELTNIQNRESSPLPQNTSDTSVNFNVTNNISLANNGNITNTVSPMIKKSEITQYSVGHNRTVTDNHFSPSQETTPSYLMPSPTHSLVYTSMQRTDSSLIGQKRRQSFDNLQSTQREMLPAYSQAYVSPAISSPVGLSISHSMLSTSLQAPLPSVQTSIPVIPLEQANSLSLSRDFHQFVLNVHGIKTPEGVPSLPPLPTDQPSSPLLQNSNNNQNMAVTAIPVQLPGYGTTTFTTNSKGQIRMTSPNPNTPKEYVCAWDHCSESFATRTGLATHCSSHLHVFMEQQAKQEAEDSQTNQKRTRIVFPCKWNNCPEVFTSLKALAKHLSLEDHVGQSPFLTKLESQQQIEYQYKTSPETKKKYLCTFPGCGKSFTDSSNRKKHERTHDANRERFHCTEPGCNRSYSTKTDLNIHLKVHKGEFPHKCTDPNCNKAFVRLSELYAHERTHDNILPHTCSACGKSFREKSRLKRHEDLHAKKLKNENPELSQHDQLASTTAAQSILRLAQANPPHTNG